MIFKNGALCGYIVEQVTELISQSVILCPLVCNICFITLPKWRIVKSFLITDYFGHFSSLDTYYIT